MEDKWMGCDLKTASHHNVNGHKPHGSSRRMMVLHVPVWKYPSLCSYIHWFLFFTR